MFTPLRFAFQFRILFTFCINTDINRCNHKGSFEWRQAEELGWLPAELLQTIMCIVGIRVAIQNQFFASSTSSLSLLKPLTLKTSVT